MMNFETHASERRAHWNRLYEKKGQRKTAGHFYQDKLIASYKNMIPAHMRILELGCGTGNLLSALQPDMGIGIDFSEKAISEAKKLHPSENLSFNCCAVEEMDSVLSGMEFDYVILSDLINDLWNVQQVLEMIRPYCSSRTRIVLNVYSRVWHLAILFGEHIGQANKTLQQNWFAPDDVRNILHLSGFETIRFFHEFLFPFPLPLIEPLGNRVFGRLWPFRGLCLANFFVARLSPIAQTDIEHSVSIVVPARNESGNIRNIIETCPRLGSETELIFVEGNSTDDTYAVIQREMEAASKEKNISCYQQTGKGKGDAVRLGFSKAKGEILIILDADLTVSPDALKYFYDALTQNKGEFINGARLVYPMQDQAMRFANFIGNKFFSLAFSWLLGQPIKDTLCGTKVMWKKDYQLVAENRAYFGDFDPFGDYDLLFGAAKLNLRMIDLPVRYLERVYGTTNISRWRHGVLLLRMVIFAARKLKFYKI